MRGEKVTRVEDVISNKLKEVPMQFVGSRFGHDIDNASGIAAVLRAVVTRFHAKFLQGIGKGERLIGVSVDVVIVGAVKPEADFVLTYAIGGDCDYFRETLCIALVDVVGRRRNRPAYYKEQRGGVAAIQGQVHNSSLFDDCAERRI